MPAGGRVLRRLARDERGMTLTELLVGAMIGLLTMTGAMIVLQMAVRNQPAANERSAHIQEGRVLLERISRELRQGEMIEVAEPDRISINTWVRSESCGGQHAPSAILCNVFYECEAGVCKRTERANGQAAGVARVVATGLLDDDVFAYCEEPEAECEPAPTASDPTYVQVTLSYPNDDGGEAITLSDGVWLRNYVPAPPQT